MSLEHDLAIIAQQELLLRFSTFTADHAWMLGTRLHELALEAPEPMSFEVQVAGRILFACATAGAPAAHADWIRRKRNTVLRFGRSTYALGLELEQDGRSMEERHGLSFTEYAMHGGGFPIVLHGTGLVGTVIASGLPQRQDHILVIAALAQAFGVQVPTLA